MLTLVCSHGGRGPRIKLRFVARLIDILRCYLSAVPFERHLSVLTCSEEESWNRKVAITRINEKAGEELQVTRCIYLKL
jgi:hypothetical protein